MSTILALPVLLFVMMLQSVIISRLPLLSGTADLVLLVIVAWSLQERVKNAWFWGLVGGVMVSFISAMPYFMPLFGYLFVVAFARLLRSRIWQIPILAMFTVTVVGTFLMHLLEIVGLFVNGQAVPFSESLNFVTMPSVLLNLILALPVYALMADLAKMVYPAEVEV